MTRFRWLLALFLFPALCGSATQIYYEGSYITPTGYSDGLHGSSLFDVDVKTEGSAYITLGATVDPEGGTYRQNTGKTFFRTVASLALNILDAGGNLMDRITLSGRSIGYDPSGFALFGSTVLDYVPASFELFLEGHDALINWTVGLFVDSPRPAGGSAEVPEPTTMLAVGLAGVVLSANRRRKRIR
jgi:hypothetical protein